MHTAFPNRIPSARPSRIRFPGTLLVLAALATAFPARVQAQYPAWTHSLRIGFNTTAAGAAVPGPVADFPLCVKLAAPDFDFSKANADGSDIRFSDADSTPLPYQVERWSKALGKAEIWVKVPKVDGASATDHITLHWGNAAAVSESDGSKVFPASGGFMAVWHLSEGGVGPRANSVTAQNPATPRNYDGDESRPGVIGLSDSLAGGTQGDHLELGSGFADFKGGFTYSVWAHPTGNGLAERFLQLGNGPEGNNIHLARDVNTTNVYFEFFTGPGTAANLKASQVLEAKWQHLTVTLQGSEGRIYKNGVLVASANMGKVIPAVVRTGNYIGRSSWAMDAYFKGKVDEPQISNAVRGPDWIRLAYETQKQDSKFFVLGLVANSNLVITSQPAPASVQEGSTATFAVSAVSARPLVYQWIKDGQAIPGATGATLAIPSVLASDAGIYRCSIGDGLNDVLSSEAVLTVSENLALWSRSMKIIINTSPQGAAVPGDVLGFPLLLRLDSTRFDFKGAEADGSDLRFADAAGSPLSHQTVRWDAGLRRGEVWVKVPKVVGGSEGNSITLFWGRAGVASRSDGASVFPAAAGWRGVWHLDDDSGASAADATGNGGSGIGTKASAGLDGLAGRAFGFGGLDSRVALPAKVTGGLKSFAFNLWARESATPVSAAAWKSPTLLGVETAGTGSGDAWILSFNGKLGFGHGFIPTRASEDSIHVSPILLNDGKWHFISLTYDGSKVTLYEAGRVVLSSPAIGTALASAGYDIGNFHWSDESRSYGFNGHIDEVQISSDALGADWIRLAYETQRFDGTAVVYGAASALPVPAPSVYPPAGIHAAPLSVVLSALSGAEIRYTLDGTSPLSSTSAAVYAGPLSLSRSANLRAVARLDGRTSEESTAAYVLTRSLPPGGKDTLDPGDTLALGSGRYLVHPGPLGSPQVTVESRTLPAVGGFERTGPLIAIGRSDAGTLFPGLALRGGEGLADGIAMFRIDGEGRLWRVEPKDGGLWLPQAGEYFWGRDTAAPRIAWLGSRADLGDSVKAAFRVVDNVRNFLWRAHYAAGRTDSTAWQEGRSGDSLVLPLGIPAGSADPIEIRLSATDRSSTAYFPRGEDRVFTLSRPLPMPSPIALEEGLRWTLAGLPFEGEASLTVGKLAEANGGAKVYAAVWQDNPADPGTGAYRILAAGEAIPSGEALWMAADRSTPALAFPSRRSRASDTTGAFPVRLVPGWNLVTNPSLRALAWPVSRKDVDAYALSKVKVAHGFDGSGYSPVDTLQPWKGYYVFNHGADTVIGLVAGEASAGHAKRAAPGPSLNLLLEDPAGSAVLMGARTWALEGRGPEDDPAPPPRQGRREGLWLLRDRRALAADFVRWEDGKAFRWTLVSRRAGGSGPGRLTLHPGVLPAGMQVWAAFPSRRVKLRLDETRHLPLGAEDTVDLYAGSPEALAALPGLGDLASLPGGFLHGYRHGARGWELVLALPSAARIRLRLVRLDGVQVGSWDREAGPGWHVWPLSGPLGRSTTDLGVLFSDLQVRGEGWSVRRTGKMLGMARGSTLWRFGMP